MAKRVLETVLKMDSSPFTIGMRNAEGSLVNFQKTSKATALGLIAISTASSSLMGALSYAGKKAIDAFQPFESALTDLGKVGVKDIGQIEKAILKLPPELGKATELTQGYYQVISAGVTKPKKALDLLTVAAQTGKSAHLDLSEIIKGLTKVMAGYEGEIETATEASDLFFTIEKLGQTTVSELIPYIGGLATISKTLNISQLELGASLAQITQFAGSMAEVSTQYEAVLTSLIKPTEEMTTLLSRYGGAQKAIKNLGFSKVLQIIANETKGSAEALGDLFGRKEAILGFLSLAKNDFANLNEKIVEMGNSTGALDNAFQNWKTTTDGLEETLSTNLNETILILGSNLAPTYNAIIELTNEWFASNQELILNALAKIPKIINDYIIPSVFGMLNAMNKVKTGFSLAWDSINMLIIDGMKYVGKFLNLFKKQKIDYDQIAEEMKQKHINSMDETLASSEKFTTSLEGLQDALLDKIVVTQKERKKVVIETNKEIEKVNNILTKEEEKRQKKVTKEKKDNLEELKKLNEKFIDDTKRLTLNDLQYKQWSLDQEYREYQDLFRKKGATQEQWANLERWYRRESVNLTKENNAEIIRSEQKKIETLTYENQTYWDGVTWGWTNYINTLPAYSEITVSIFQGMTGAMQSSFSSLIYDTMTGETKSFSEYWKSFVSEIFKSFANMVAQMITKWLALKATMAIGGALGLGGGVGGAITGGGGGGGGILGAIGSAGAAAVGGGGGGAGGGGIGAGIAGIGTAGTGAGIAAGTGTGGAGVAAGGAGVAAGGAGATGGGAAGAVGGTGVAGGAGGGGLWAGAATIGAAAVGIAAVGGMIHGLTQWGKGDLSLLDLGWPQHLRDELDRKYPHMKDGKIRGITKMLPYRPGMTIEDLEPFYFSPRGEIGGLGFGAQEGAIITKEGKFIPAGRDGIPMIGHPGEAIIPFDKLARQASPPMNITNHFHLHGINADSARSIVRDHIIPELNFYLTSKNKRKMF